MIKNNNSTADEIEASVMKNLSASKDDGKEFHNALQSLAHTAELFEEANFPEEAEILTQVLETIASGQFGLVKEAKKKKSKSKSKKSKKKTFKTKLIKIEVPEMKEDLFTKNLNPENELKNLEEIGWVFNLPGKEEEKNECGCNDAGNVDKFLST